MPRFPPPNHQKRVPATENWNPRGLDQMIEPLEPAKIKPIKEEARLQEEFDDLLLLKLAEKRKEVDDIRRRRRQELSRLQRFRPIPKMSVKYDAQSYCTLTDMQKVFFGSTRYIIKEVKRKVPQSSYSCRRKWFLGLKLVPLTEEDKKEYEEKALQKQQRKQQGDQRLMSDSEDSDVETKETKMPGGRVVVKEENTGRVVMELGDDDLGGEDYKATTRKRRSAGTRKRGRPRSTPVVVPRPVADPNSADSLSQPVKKPRGRPRFSAGAAAASKTAPGVAPITPPVSPPVSPPVDSPVKSPVGSVFKSSVGSPAKTPVGSPAKSPTKSLTDPAKGAISPRVCDLLNMKKAKKKSVKLQTHTEVDDDNNNDSEDDDGTKSLSIEMKNRRGMWQYLHSKGPLGELATRGKLRQAVTRTGLAGRLAIELGSPTALPTKRPVRSKPDASIGGWEEAPWVHLSVDRSSNSDESSLTLTQVSGEDRLKPSPAPPKPKVVRKRRVKSDSSSNRPSMEDDLENPTASPGERRDGGRDGTRTRVNVLRRMSARKTEEDVDFKQQQQQNGVSNSHPQQNGVPPTVDSSPPTQNGPSSSKSQTADSSPSSQKGVSQVSVSSSSTKRSPRAVVEGPAIGVEGKDRKTALGAAVLRTLQSGGKKKKKGSKKEQIVYTKKQLAFKMGSTLSLAVVKAKFYPGRQTQMITKSMHVRVPGCFYNRTTKTFQNVTIEEN